MNPFEQNLQCCCFSIKIGKCSTWSFFISLQGTAAEAEWCFCGLSTTGEDDNRRPYLVCAGAFPDLINALGTWL